MSATDGGGQLELDVENRNMVGGRRTKRDEPPARSVQVLANKRAALGTLNAANVVRVQPFRTAKLLQACADGSHQNENIPPPPQQQQQQKLHLGFAIHNDSATADMSEGASSSSASSSQTSTCRLPANVTTLHRLPLTSLPIVETDYRDAESEGSPMVLDESCLEHDMKNSCYKTVCYPMEYAQEIYQYLRTLEAKYRPKAHYLKKQPDISSNMRSILVDWLVEVGEEYKLQTETLHLAINYIDRFLSFMSVMRTKLQLVGTACMFIAAKFEEIYPPDVGEFVYITDETYTKKQVLKMEHLILKVLSFDLAVPTSFYFLERFCRIARAGDVIEYLAMYLCELTLLEADPYLRYLPSIIAGAAVCLAQFMCGREVWSEELRVMTGYDVNDFSDCLVHLHNTLVNAASHPQQAVREKYRSPQYNSVANMAVPVSLPF